MATYAIGDVQGCHERLLALLDRIDFDPSRDRLRFAGDLVNRGPQSLAVLRFVMELGDDVAQTVLGNHDLHLLAAAHGLREPSRGDTLDEILAAPDRDALLDWLRRRPLLHQNPDNGNVLVHAGIPPQWDLPTARRCAAELQSVLSGKRLENFLRHMYGNRPRRWSEDLEGHDRLRYITNAFTRMRYLDSQARLDFDEKRPPGEQGDGLQPWVALPRPTPLGAPVVFGHWASLQAIEPLDPRHGVHHIDTGCVWGGPLTALREDDNKLFQVEGLRTS